MVSLCGRMQSLVEITDEARSAFTRSGVGDQAEWIIEGWFVAGCSRWPGVRVSREQFASWI